jgi:hypothetical protein
MKLYFNCIRQQQLQFVKSMFLMWGNNFVIDFISINFQLISKIVLYSDLQKSTYKNIFQI